MCSSYRRQRTIYRFLAVSGDLVLDGAQTLYLDAHHVAALEEPHGVHRHAHARRGPGEDEVAGHQRARLGDEVDDLPRPEDEVAGRAVLAQLAVDPRLQRKPARIADLVGRGDPRAPRAR